MTGRVESVQVGRPAELAWRRRSITTAIVKRPVAGEVALGPLGFEGDEQADRRVHGGPDKAVCVYADEYISVWEEQLGLELPPGAFGENLRLSGLLESDVHVGDVFSVGTATVQVSQPRGPCFKLAARWDRKELPAFMARAGISGWYFRVLEPGTVEAGDELRLRSRVSDISIAEVMRVTYVDRGDRAAIAAVLAVPELAESWRMSLLAITRRPQLELDFEPPAEAG